MDFMSIPMLAEKVNLMMQAGILAGKSCNSLYREANDSVYFVHLTNERPKPHALINQTPACEVRSLALQMQVRCYSLKMLLAISRTH